jgi:hypothetical protein
MTCGHSQTMKIGLEGLSWSDPVSDQLRVTLCCRERATESDADVVAYSKLSSPWENTQSRLLLSLMSSESGFRGGREMEDTLVTPVARPAMPTVPCRSSCPPKLIT